MVKVHVSDEAPSVAGNTDLMSGQFVAVDTPRTSTTLAGAFEESGVSHAPSPKHIDITEELPSSLAFYPQFSDGKQRIYARPFGLSELRSYATSVNADSLRGIVDTVARCISSPVDVYDMTRGDFYTILYWIRLQSHKKTPLNIRWTCSSDKHLDLVEEGKLKADTVFHDAVIRGNQDLEVHTLSKEQIAKIEEVFLKCKEEYGILLYPTRVADDIEILEITKLLAESLKEGTIGRQEMQDFIWSANLARFISANHGATIQDRIQFLNTIEDPDFPSIVKQFEVFSYHGVKQHVNLTCKECGETKRVALEVDLRKFFPFVQ